MSRRYQRKFFVTFLFKGKTLISFLLCMVLIFMFSIAYFGISNRSVSKTNGIKIVIDALKDTPVVLRGYDRGTEQVWGSPAEFPRDDV